MIAPHYEDAGLRLWHGPNMEILPTFADASFDSIVTDPPYELGFMGKGWDSSGIAYDVDVWRECLRVLKPGGHLLAFGGSRTWHRMAVAIEDAGFEMRDSIAWLYGSGFPKSLDVAKAVDKLGGVARPDQGAFRDACRAQMAALGIRVKDVDAALGNVMSSRYFTYGAAPALPNVRDYGILRGLLQLGDRFDHMWADEAQREVVGLKRSGIATPGDRDRQTIGGSRAVDVEVTASATEAALEWDGWGTALKPAFEPIVVARKPFRGTVAANVLAHGTGALNIDATRVETNDALTPGGGHRQEDNNVFGKGLGVSSGRSAELGARWPTNVLLDESQAEALDAQSGVLTSGKMTPVADGAKRQGAAYGAFAARTPTGTYGDSGGASRYFPTFRYEAKAPTSERPNVEGTVHATVKPLALIRWLVRLVTRPGGRVLDLYAGSGTTGEAALLEGMEVDLIELEEDHLPLILARVRKPLHPGLFGDWNEEAS
jgi:site-specific DNA-methyltransferase (adenine-specific)